ncbi:MAG: 2-oxoacid:ferredoxin oxidoreductase subunit beta, partial [Gemmatimonadales bacterium]
MPETNGHGTAASQEGDRHRLASLTLVPRAATRSAAKDCKSDQEVRWCPGCG